VSNSISSTSTISSIFTTPFQPGSTLSDFPLIFIYKLVFVILALIISSTRYSRLDSLSPPMIYSKPNLSKTDKEEESLEESWSPYLSRLFSRPMFLVHQSSVITLLYLCVKCMYRLLKGADPSTAEWPWWCALSSAVLFTILELSYVASACEAVKGRLSLVSLPSSLRDYGSDVSLRDPLLGSDTAPSTANNSKEGSPVAEKGGGGKEGGERISEVPEPDIGAGKEETDTWGKYLCALDILIPPLLLLFTMR
jgi:hypothetical protein